MMPNVSAIAPTLTVVTVTFNNSSAELARFSEGFNLACAQASALGLNVQLLYRDNGAPSNLDASAWSARVASEPAVMPTAASPAAAHSQRNIGYGPAMHLLWSQAFAEGANAVITANPDGCFHPACIVRLHELSVHKPGNLYEARQFPSEHPKAYNPISGVSDWASGCCVYVPKELFERVGNVDPDFWLYMEDVDYSWRTRAAGRHILVCPNGLYAHETINRTLSDRARREMLLAGRRLGWKWGSAKFQNQCERSLAQQFPTFVNLPPLVSAPVVSTQMQQFADFSRPFNFADIRWAL